MREFVQYFIKYPIAGNLLMVFILAGGIFAVTQMQSTFFPETESRIIRITTTYPGSSPEEIEEGIILKIEENLKGLTGIERVSSVSSENIGNITIEVQRGYDADLVLQDVKNAVDRINSFPANMEAPVIFKDENLGFAISFALSGPVDLLTLKQVGRDVEDELLDMQGISKVSLSGFPEEEIEISFREKDLRAYELTFAEAAEAVRRANLEITGGKLKGETEELLIRSRNREYFARDIENIVVKTTLEGSTIRLFQIADVTDQWEESPVRTFMNAEKAVVVTVQNTLEEDMLSITEKIRKYIDGFNVMHDDVQATIIRDGSVNLNQRIGLLRKNGILGFFIVLTLLAMFLNWRLAFWVALAIPISFAGMFVFAWAIGITINVISLFGMILVIGILVDDGIVIAENIYQYHEQGMSRYKAALNGTMDVLPAVFAAILTTIIAFSTFFFIEGRLGDIFRDLAWVVSFSLVFSLVEGALILPGHVGHSKALDPNLKKNRFTRGLDDFMMAWRNKLYAPSLKFAMENKILTMAVPVGILLITFGAIQGGIIRTTFFPVIPRDNINVELKLPAGTREDLTNDWLRKIEQAAWKVNKDFSDQYYAGEREPIEKIERSVGPNSFEGTLNITLLDGESRDSVTARMISAAIRKETGPVYDAEVLSFGATSVFGKPISISVLGNNYDELGNAIKEIEEELNKVNDLKDVVNSNREGLREIDLKLKDKAYALGLSVQDVVGQVRQGFFGNEVQRLQRGVDEVKVWVRYDEDYRSDFDNLRAMRLRFPNGGEYPLSEIAEFEISRGVIAINHLDGKREIKVEADIASDKVSVSDITEDLRNEVIPPIMAKYPSVSVLFEGQNREQQKSQTSLQTFLPVILLVMFFVIALTFRSISQTLIVFTLVPFGLIGVGWGHWMMDAPISLLSILGVVALIGILVNDALVFITTYNDLLRDGVKHNQAVYDAAISRFRPIILTTLTTIAGLAPLILEKSFQAQFLIPMAISVAFGLLLVTFIILVLLPVLLLLVNRIKRLSVFMWYGEWVPHTSLEAAIENRESHFIVWFVGGLLSVAAFIGILVIMFRLSTTLF